MSTDGGKLSHLSHPDDVDLTTENSDDMEHQFNSVHKDNLYLDLQTYGGKTKHMTHTDATDSIQTDILQLSPVDLDWTISNAFFSLDVCLIVVDLESFRTGTG